MPVLLLLQLDLWECNQHELDTVVTPHDMNGVGYDDVDEDSTLTGTISLSLRSPVYKVIPGARHHHVCCWRHGLFFASLAMVMTPSSTPRDTQSHPWVVVVVSSLHKDPPLERDHGTNKGS
jgi:hypothetical protein